MIHDKVKDCIVGYTDGVFDLFHTGHLNIIKEAKQRCDFLIVGVHSDSIVEQYKKKNTIINEVDRQKIVESIRYVDRAVINSTRDKLELWRLYQFDVIFIGDDWKGTERWNNFEKLLNKVGVSVEYIPYTVGISTTQIRERLAQDCPERK